MEFIQPVFEIVKCISAPVARRINYAWNLTKNFRELDAKATDLYNRRDDIKDKIDQLRLQKAPTRECQHWIVKVGEIENQMKIIEEEYYAKKKCLKGWFPDIFSRVELGERVVEMINSVKDTYEKSKFEGGFVTDLPLAKVEKQPVPKLTAKSSADRTLQKVMNSTRDQKSQKIGIWGMGGVGKTTVMQLLNNSAEITTMFDVVIWVTVSKSWSIRKVQNEIAQRLSIEITNMSDTTVASKLLLALESKKYLLLLDDVWEMVDLNAMGIPNTNQENGCKVILTTREHGVCRKMGTDVEINVAVLSEEEAWEMFYLEVGAVAVFPTIKPLAEDVVRKCDGLPLALKVVGSVLRKQESVDVWSDFLSDLKSPATSSVDDIDEKVFRPLKASYDQLKDTNYKKCFLYCGLYPEDYKMKKSELIKYWRAEGFLSRKLTLADAGAKGSAILKALIDSSLLERCEEDECVKMHDVIRDLVLRMTSPNGEEGICLVRAGFNNMAPDDQDWESATRISFMDNELGSLPKFPKCPVLLTLLLRGNRLSEIPESFFNHMPNLQVLDLSENPIRSLPTSISNLVSLRALLLKKCQYLEALPEEVSVLKKLEVLRVTGTLMMPCLPNKIWELNNLKCLKFSTSYDGNAMTNSALAGGTISRLSQMEELSIQERGSFLLSDGITADSVIIKEVSCMTRLSSLVFGFPRVDHLQHFLQNSKPWRDGTFKKFLFMVGGTSLWYNGRMPDYIEKKRSLIYEGGRDGDGSSIIPSAIMEVLVCSESFALINHGEIKNLSDLGMRNIRGLKFCSVAECDALETIIGSVRVEVLDAFPNLEILELYRLSNLKSIIMEEGLPMQPRNSCFTSLRELLLYNCLSIKKLFSWGLIQQLHNLESISIYFCEELEEMISVEDNNDYEMLECSREVLPKLRKMTFKYLPNFVGFVKGISLFWSSLLEVEISGCPKLKRLPFGVNNNAPNLREIRGKYQWWEALEWEDDAIKTRLSPLYIGF